ncbi:MAG: NADH-quinone oxidoreductase subunit M, partial [Pseudomonadota bacterium]
MFLDNLLSIVIFIPLIAAAILGLFLRGNDEAAQNNAKYVALAATLASLLASLFVLAGFDPDDTGFQFLEEG